MVVSSSSSLFLLCENKRKKNSKRNVTFSLFTAVPCIKSADIGDSVQKMLNKHITISELLRIILVAGTTVRDALIENELTLFDQ